MRMTFEPDWFSPPGMTLTRLMARKEIETCTLANCLSEDRAFVRRLLAGTERIDPRLAKLLSTHVGGSVSFWTKRQRQFDKALIRFAKKIPPEHANAWLRSLPMREMQNAGWLQVQEGSELVHAAMAYFKVTGPKDWHEQYTSFATQFSYRTSPSFESKIGALAAWLRQGEVEASALRCAPWNADAFRKALKKIRGFTRLKDPAMFVGRLRSLCAEVGVAVVFVKAPAGCRASGATRFLNERKAMMILSFRHLSDDHFWFSFFHEAGHILLHGPTETFVDGEAAEETLMETEANAFAAGQLVPLREQEQMLDLRPRATDVIRFAVSIGIAPGIIVGQLQHHDRIGRNQLNNLKRRYTWEQVLTAIR